MKLSFNKEIATVAPETAMFEGMALPVYSCNTVIVGSGAAGLNAADTLWDMDLRDILIVTEGMNMGTSRNTGSDKQTYYKLTIAGNAPDSVEEMAESLFAGGSMHGDTALVEAAFSVRSFSKLVNIGVPFPHNRYGEYVGYKTDHDPRQRATSCGPLTSRFMTERLEKCVRAKGIAILDGVRIIAVITKDNGGEQSATGLLGLDVNAPDNAETPLVLINCTNVIYATGGPSGLYHASVYPESQTCATGIALEAGAPGVNLTESQYGIASLKFRWNLSGTYQQVMPRYISVAADGSDEREFLDSHFADAGAMLNAIFLKGYQWPFDPRKLNPGGSSRVDLAVFEECRLGRRVYLDFRRNPSRMENSDKIDWSLLGEEARTYLENSAATQATPIERLKVMNQPAYQLYRDNGIDLASAPLEIAVCAQHNNGGLAVNIWWESELRHFFPVGEIAGTFGVYRPGGTALNSTQVGGLRAAQFICNNYPTPPQSVDEFTVAANSIVTDAIKRIHDLRIKSEEKTDPYSMRASYQKMMDGCGAFLRPREDVRRAIDICRDNIMNFEKRTRVTSLRDLAAAFINRDILLTQYAYLCSINEYSNRGGKSRGSYLVCDSSDNFAHVELDDGKLSTVVCEVRLRSDSTGVFDCEYDWKPVRKIPLDRDEWFELIYNQWRRNEIIRS